MTAFTIIETIIDNFKLFKKFIKENKRIHEEQL